MMMTQRLQNLVFDVPYENNTHNRSIEHHILPYRIVCSNNNSVREEPGYTTVPALWAFPKLTLKCKIGLAKGE